MQKDISQHKQNNLKKYKKRVSGVDLSVAE